MKILFDHHEPFLLAHGGMEILCGETMNALNRRGIDAEPMRWWDKDQQGDIIHCYGRPSPAHIRFAHAKGIAYVFHELLTAQGSRPLWRIRMQGLCNRLLARLFPAGLARWESYALADAIIASTSWEARLMRILYSAPENRLHVIPTGVHLAFFEAGHRREPPAPEAALLCVATITERKGVLDLIRAATTAGVPLDIIGRPYSEADPYFLACTSEASRSEGRVRLLGPVEDPNELASRMARARAFVLWSSMETESTAALAAAAAGLPLLLTDLPWARSTFPDAASLIPIAETRNASRVARRLQTFYSSAKCAFRASLPTWDDVAEKVENIYRDLASE